MFLKITTKLFLALTAFSPVFLVCAFLEGKNAWYAQKSDFSYEDFSYAIILGVVFVFLLISCYAVIKFVMLSKSIMPTQKFSASHIKPADYELIGFVMVYVFPFLTTGGIDAPTLIFISIFFIVMILVTNAYHFNPILGLLGYHFFEVSKKTSDDGIIVFTLISSRKIRKISEVAEAAQLTEYIFLDMTRKE